MQRHINIILASTPYKMGTLIRTATGYPYNHVCVSPSEDLQPLYSFARRYYDAPFYGGFCRESWKRYERKGKCADIKVFTCPIAEEAHQKLLSLLSQFEADSDAYVYNMFSAISFLLGKNVQLQKAFTCVEFVVHLLRECAFLPDDNRFYSIEALDKLLTPYLVYEGSSQEHVQNASWQGDIFPEQTSLLHRIRMTLKSNQMLLGYYFRQKDIK